jgi:hypothetical protein
MTTNQPDTRSVSKTRSERNNSEISSRKEDVSKRQRARPHACRAGVHNRTSIQLFQNSQHPDRRMDAATAGASEFTILICVARFTFGFHRNQVAIGMRLLAHRTGLHPETVSLAVRALEGRGLLICTAGSRGRITYAVQVDASPAPSEKPNSHCTENPNADCTENPYTRKKSSSSKENYERNSSPADSGRPQQPEVIPDASEIPPQPEAHLTSTPVFFEG